MKVLKFSKYSFLTEMKFIKEGSEFQQFQFGLEPMGTQGGGGQFAFAQDPKSSYYNYQDSPYTDFYARQSGLVANLNNIVKNVRGQSDMIYKDLNPFLEDINKIPLLFKLLFELLYMSLIFKDCKTDLDYFNLLFNKYMTKNILNKFRQDNGYKDNFYIKDWDGREDNIVVFEFVNNLENKNMLLKSNTFEDVIYGFMNSTYTYVKNIERKKEK